MASPKEQEMTISVMTLKQQAEILAESLGLKGSISAVLGQAAAQLGVPARGSLLMELGSACVDALRRRAAAPPPRAATPPPRAAAPPPRAAAPPPRAEVPPPLLPTAPPSRTAAPGPPPAKSSPPAAAPPAPPVASLAAGARVELHGLPGTLGALNGQSGSVVQADQADGSYDVRLDPPHGQATAGKMLEGLRSRHLRALPLPLAAVWEVKLRGAFQPFQLEVEQRALEQAWGRGESQVQLARHVVHLTGPMRQVAEHGKGREVRRRVL